ncbi:ATP-dependent DNA ligase [Rhodococcus zopfii]|uniref:ATP-dependent DNA ligase n=1 Tax=Rhodococcus zopfii TaxID=43772 RepID=UPI0011110D22|nr:ATP-dependent DNA ligase [Rhodococcus zopfii]
MPTRTFGDSRLKLTNLDKVLYPRTGTTKGEVIDYYVAIADAMLPHVAGRAGTRKRWPNGVDDQAFFEKNLAAHAPSWLDRRTLHHKQRTVTYPLFDSAASLAWLGQQAALELHVPQWRFAANTQGAATRIVFDLDPGEGVALSDCARVARLVRDTVAELGWTAYPVTSGSKGIHLYVPLERPLQSGGASTVARTVATNLEKLYPDRVTATMAKAARGGRVFLDWSQNNAAKTTVAPYSLRGREQPWVAAPRTWDELDDPGLSQLRFDQVLARVETDGDLLAELDPPLPVQDRADALAEYRGKRDASRTPEPVPDTVAAGGPGDRFVIQEHRARRLHYDLRLERDGVLASWAVPKNLPDEPGRNHLAVRTEDHPLEYLTFHGTIPKGEYGAGTMTVWDTGTYVAEKWRDDEVIVQLQGRRLQGRYALIRTEGTQWLAHLMKDQAPSGAGPFPRDLAPMLATLGDVTDLDERDWVFEGKWDGIRAVVEVHDGGVRIRSRSGRDITAEYPSLGILAQVLDGHDAVLDGEIVAFDPHQVTSFPLLQSGGRPVFLAFDILYLDGVSLQRKPYSDRRRVLELLGAAAPGLQVPDTLSGNGTEALAQSIDRGWEGVVAKRCDSVYLPGKRGTAWIKAKNWLTQEVVVAGYRPGQGARSGTFGALLLGVYEGDDLVFVGRVGSGFDDRTLTTLTASLQRLRRRTSPFAENLPTADARGAVWVTPRLVGEVRFQSWTGGGRLRHPIWRGLRDDIEASDVRRADS